MSNNEAKLHLSLQDGVFEISGSELFVSQQIENFKEIILDALQNREKLEPKAINSGDSGAGTETMPITAPETEKPVTHYGSKEFPRVLHVEGTDVRIIKRMPGNTTAKKAVNTALAYLWGKKTVGTDHVPYQEIRDLCQEQGCLDSANFSAQMKGAKEHFIIDGKKGSSAKTCKLTLPGVERAEELLEDLNGE